MKERPDLRELWNLAEDVREAEARRDDLIKRIAAEENHGDQKAMSTVASLHRTTVQEIADPAAAQARRDRQNAAKRARNTA
ncbi:hypothetical protein J7F03_02740 [Streptomyces sp. ISL-43]|nr:hypothetical protein [Streptomyces sp. ISL-43]